VLESRVNLIKNSIELRKISPGQFSLSFNFDSSEACMIRFYWLASEDIKWSNDVIKSVEYASKSRWTFGPFDSGLNQKFDLPNSHLVDLSVFKAKDLEGDDPSSLLDTDSPQALEENEITQNDQINAQVFPLVIVLETIGSGNLIQF
jgi:hypothetical protein